MDALEANDLGEMLSQPGHFTIFVPTDEAFEKLDEKTRDKILGNGGCSADLIKSHILSEVKKRISSIIEIKFAHSRLSALELLIVKFLLLIWLAKTCLLLEIRMDTLKLMESSFS